MSECPRGEGKAFQLSEWFPPEWSGETTELGKSVVAIERVPREGPGGARGRQSSCEDVQRRSLVPLTPRTRLVARHLNHKPLVGAALFVSMVADTTWEAATKHLGRLDGGDQEEGEEAANDHGNVEADCCHRAAECEWCDGGRRVGRGQIGATEIVIWVR